jgi:hypothetical protein
MIESGKQRESDKNESHSAYYTIKYENQKLNGFIREHEQTINEFSFRISLFAISLSRLIVSLSLHTISYSANNASYCSLRSDYGNNFIYGK